MHDAGFERQLRRALGDRPAAVLLEVLEGFPEAAFVGGWVRDVLLGRPSDDVDLVVGEPADLALVLRSAGVVRKDVVLDEERGTRRVVFRDGRYVDVASLRGDLTEDLALRDLRINAMAWRPGRGVLDPLDGRRDLAERTLRLASKGALVADPVRALRLWRFALELEARPADPLPELDLSGVAAERIRGELERILAHARCFEAVDALHAAGLLAQALPGRLRPSLVRARRGGHGVGRCFEQAASRPDGLLAARLGWLCADADLETALVQRRWARRTARLAAATSEQVGVEIGDVPRELMAWRERIAWALLGRTALADDPEAAVAPYLAALDGAAGRPEVATPVPDLPTPALPVPEVQEALGLRAGPAIGEAMARLVEAQLRGEVVDEASARRWLQT